MAAALSEEDLRISVWDEHEGILRALEAGQAAEAEALCRGHAEQMADILTGRLKVVISPPPEDGAFHEARHKAKEEPP